MITPEEQQILKKQGNKLRISTSSEDGDGLVNTNEDLTDPIRNVIQNQRVKLKEEHMLYQHFLDCRLKEQRVATKKGCNQNQPGTLAQHSFEDDYDFSDEENGQQLDSTDDRKRKMIKQVENAKAKMYDVSGELKDNLLYAVIADEDYEIVGSHIDEVTKQKIVSGLYVDFAKLIPKD